MSKENFPEELVITDALGPRVGKTLGPNMADNAAHLLIERYADIKPAVGIALGMFGQGASPEEVFNVLSNIEYSYLNPQSPSS